jgi:hypothetical protein
MRIIHRALIAATLAASTLGLAGCYEDGYTSLSIGVSSYAGYGYGNRGYYRGYRDYDRDGVPHRYDIAPRNPYVN